MEQTSKSKEQVVGVPQTVGQLCWSVTSVPGMNAAGDVADRVNLALVALMEGMAFAKHVFGWVVTILFCDNRWVLSTK